MDLKAALRDRESVTGTWVSIGHPTVAELASEQGFDAVFLDTEHSPNSTETIENQVRAVDAGGDAAAVVRVAWNDPVRIKRVLDTGPAGVMSPMLESREDAEAFVEATRYPPEGIRGMAAARASGYGTRFEEYVEEANDSIATVGQIETMRGVENAHDIAAVDGLDALFVGPADLSASVGEFGAPGERFDAALDEILAAGEATDTAVGTLATDVDGIPDWVDAGVDFLVVGVDVGYLAAGADRARTAYEDARRGE